VPRWEGDSGVEILRRGTGDGVGWGGEVVVGRGRVDGCFAVGKGGDQGSILAILDLMIEGVKKN